MFSLLYKLRLFKGNLHNAKFKANEVHTLTDHDQMTEMKLVEKKTNIYYRTSSYVFSGMKITRYF